LVVPTHFELSTSKTCIAKWFELARFAGDARCADAMTLYMDVYMAHLKKHCGRQPGPIFSHDTPKRRTKRMTHRLLPLNDGFRSSIYWFAREFSKWTATLARLPIQKYWLQFQTTRFHDFFAFNEQSQRNDNLTWRAPLYGIRVGLHTNPLQWWSFAPKDRCHVTTFSHVDVFNSLSIVRF